MKKYFLYIVIMVAFAACGGGDDSGGDDPVIVTNEHLSVSSSSIQLPGAENESELMITANCNWTVSTDVDWISLDPASGNGNGTVTISVGMNSTGSDRTGTIFVKNEKQTLEKKVRVTQGTPTSALVPTINDNDFPE